jgi:phosphonatase-like hydrolase
MNLEMVAFDVAGTVLNDDGLVINAFKKAFEASQPELWPIHGVEWTQYALDTMGQSKIHVFTTLLGDSEQAYKANAAFEEAYMNEIAETGATPIPGAKDVISFLKEIGVKVALTTGFSRTTLDSIITELGWGDLIDASITPSEAGRGRPEPDMLIKVAEMLGISSPQNVIVVGDTAADMQAAIAFGAGKAIGVLTGAHKEEQLREAGATSVVNSVFDLKSLISC